MKLADLKTTTEVITPLHPALGDVGVKFNVCSPFSREHNAATARLHGEIFSDKSELEDTVKWDIYQAEAVMVGWSGIENEDGTPMEFNAQNLAELFRNPDLYWMVQQVGEYLSKKKGYLQTMLNRLKDLSE